MRIVLGRRWWRLSRGEEGGVFILLHRFGDAFGNVVDVMDRDSDIGQLKSLVDYVSVAMSGGYAGHINNQIGY